MSVRSKSKPERRRPESAMGSDLISGLGDDVLVHILELLPDAGDAVRTGAISRRWRGLWMRVTSLTFDSSSRPAFSDVERFASFVNSAIAVRAAQTDPAVQHLAISFETPHELLPPSVVSKAAAPRWIRDAVQHDVKTFTLELRHGGAKANAWAQYATMILDDDLPRSARMETMRLALGGTTVRLPKMAAAFSSLADLTLESMEFAVDNGHLLTRLLSSACCPRLQKLRLTNVSFATSTILEELELLIEAEELLELLWEEVITPRIHLKLRTPRLRVLRTVDIDIRELTISAPRLEELLFLDAVRPFSNIHIDGELPCVRSLRVGLLSHTYDYEGQDEDYVMENGGTFSLLRCCTAAACLDLDLHVSEIEIDQEDDRAINLIEGHGIPPLPQVTSLTVHVYLHDLHSFGFGIEDILTQCSNLKYLRICRNFRRDNDSDSPPMQDNDFDSPFLCNHQDNWQSPMVYCLPHLEEVEFMGLAGTECEIWFMESMLTTITQPHKVAISFGPKSSLKNRIHAFERITGNTATTRDVDLLPLERVNLSWECKPSL